MAENDNIKNLDKLPQKAARVLLPFISKLERSLSGNIRSVFVYGSVTGPDFIPGRSDINTAVIVNDWAIERLEGISETVRAFRREKIAMPLFLTEEYIKDSMDTYPMEFSEMRGSYCVLIGEDVLKKLEIKHDDLRRECEYQLNGKLITIRQAYLENAISKNRLERLLKDSLRALMPVFRTVLRIKDPSAARITQRSEVLKAIGQEFGIDVSLFMKISDDLKNDGLIGKIPLEKHISGFLKELEKLSRIVDKL